MGLTHDNESTNDDGNDGASADENRRSFTHLGAHRTRVIGLAFAIIAVLAVDAGAIVTEVWVLEALVDVLAQFVARAWHNAFTNRTPVCKQIVYTMDTLTQQMNM